MAALVDTGASLSTIDHGLAQRLGAKIEGERLRINGVGQEHSLGHTTLAFCLDTTDATGQPARLVFRHDFHVLPRFRPGVCLGQDWIEGHRVVVDMGRLQGSLEHHFPSRKSIFSFPVRGRPPPARTFSAKVCTKQAVTLPPACHSWVDVDLNALAEGTDYSLLPTFLCDPHCNQGAIAVPCLVDHSMHKLLVTNFSNEAFELPSRTLLGQATAHGPGTLVAQAPTAFTLHADKTAAGQPFDPFEFDEQPAAVDASQAATAKVDGTWEVGVDAAGQPHPDIVALLRQHKHAFSLDGRPGHVLGPELEIPVPDESKLRAEAPRRVSPEKRRAIDENIAQLLDWDVIEPSSSPISAPIHLVRQRDKLRFCVDYRSLNAATTPDRYPLPRIDDVLESLRGAHWFSSLDAIRGYHQTDIAPQDRWKTAFTTHRGLLQYRRVPFGLRNAPAFFQRFMDGLLGPLRWIYALVYLDDVLVYTRTLGEHLQALRHLFIAAERVGLKFSPSKCTFAVQELNLLGRKVSGYGLGVMQDRASAIRDLGPPRTLRRLHHVLGLLSYYRQFIPRFATIAAPLYDLLKGWSYKKDGSTARLVREDGSHTSADAVLLDWQHRHQHAFDELKGGVTSPPTLPHPNYDRPFLLYTDACKTGFAAAIHQIHVLPAGAEAASYPLEWSQLPVDTDHWRRLQEADPLFGPILRRLDGQPSSSDAKYCLRNGLLHLVQDGRLCLPKAAVPDMLHALHDDRGHFGYTKTYVALARDFWHPGLSSLVEAYVRFCTVCIRTKLSRRVGALDIDHDAKRPFEHISIYVLLGLPRTRAGHDAMIVAVDTFSKMILLHPCTSAFSAKDIADFILHRVIRMGWMPSRLTSDHDSRIMGEAIRTLGRYTQMECTPTPPHHHRANPVERHIQSVNRVLRAMANSGGTPWDGDTVCAIELAFNSTPSVATGISPLDAVFIDAPRVLDRILSGDEHAGVGAWTERFERAKRRLAEARWRMRVERERQKAEFDGRNAALPTVTPGQLVWIRLRDRPVRATREGKLGPAKLGPYPIRRVLTPHRVLVDVPAELNITGEFDLSQVDLHPQGDDPFDRQPAEPSTSAVAPPQRTGNDTTRTAPASPRAEGDSGGSEVRRGSRVRVPAAVLRYSLVQTYTAQVPLQDSLLSIGADAFKRPLGRSKVVTLEGTDVRLVERPVAFLSRATTEAEKKLAGPELELICLAWAFTRAQHLLEGAPVTVVTDHAPIPGMLTSRPGLIPYKTPVDRARAVLRPHRDHLRFVHKPGHEHTNVDALSRLVQPNSATDRDDGQFFEGGM